MAGYGATYADTYPASSVSVEEPPPEQGRVRRLVRLGLTGGPRLADLLRPPALVARPGATNTGLAGDYTGLQPSGSLTVTTNGAVIDATDLLGTLTIRADDVHLRRSRFRGVEGEGVYTIAWGTVSGRPPRGLVLEDVEIDGNGINGGDAEPYPTGAAQSAAIQPGIGYSVIRCDVHGHTDGLKPQDNPEGQSILIDRSWVHDLVTYYIGPGSPTHNDILQIASTGAHDVTIRGCYLDGYRPWDPNIVSRFAASSLVQWGSFPGTAGVLRNVVIEDNWVDGGGYASRLDAVGLAVCQDVFIRRNRFGLHHRFGVIRNSTVSLDGGQIQAFDNVWDVTGTTDSGLAVVAGQPL